MARTHYSEIEGRSGAYLALLGVLTALALGMIVVMILCISGYTWLQRITARSLFHGLP